MNTADKPVEKVPAKGKKDVKPPLSPLTITDIILGTVRDALEFNAQVIELATQVIATDPSGHNKTAYRRITESFQGMNKAYVARLDAANQKIVAQFIRQPEDKKNESKD